MKIRIQQIRRPSSLFLAIASACLLTACGGGGGGSGGDDTNAQTDFAAFVQDRFANETDETSSPVSLDGVDFGTSQVDTPADAFDDLLGP